MPSDSTQIHGESAIESSGAVHPVPPVTPQVNLDSRAGHNQVQHPTGGPSPEDVERNHDGSQIARPASPSQIAAGARSSQELLRRLSLPMSSSAARESKISNPRARYDNLNLSGRIISVNFLIPFTAKISQDGGWKLTPRMGSAALFDHFSHLSSQDSSWDHVLVGWTGEITRESKTSHYSAPQDSTGDCSTPLNGSQTPLHRTHMKQAKADSPQAISVSSTDRTSLNNLLGKHQGGKVVPVWLIDEMNLDSDTYVLKDQRRWRRFPEQQLYNLFHYKQNEPSNGRDSKKSWADYYKMNKIFADRIEELYQPGDIVLVHNYQLLLLPGLLRQRIPKIYVGFFLHIPFPTSELYRCLTPRKELLEGVLGSNMIGFQSYGYSRHFSSCCTRILGFDSSSVGVDAYGAHVAVDVFPMGINVQSILKFAFEDPAVEKKVAGIQKLYAGKKIIVGRDRMDAFRGISQKLQAFELFLENNEEWRGKVVLVQISHTSERSFKQMAEDKKYANIVGDLVARINGTYGSSSYAPVHHFTEYISKEDYFALLRAADLGLITSIRDGMNITGLEYVICQRDNHNPLILSEFSGTAGSLSDAIPVNPWDLISLSEAINKALSLSEAAKTQQHTKLYSYVIKNNIQTWTDKFLHRLLTNISSYDQSFATPVLDRSLLLKQYRRAKNRLFMFDYDGTLTPIVRDPEAAIPSDRVLRTLKTLASDQGNSVWVISGRDQAFLDEWMGHISELGLSAEHGSFIRWSGTDEWDNVAEDMDMSWRDEVLRIFTHYTERTQGSFVETKKIALTWHYRRADPEYGAYQAHECHRELEEKVAKRWDVEVMTGKANLEVRPRFVNKGEIAKKLIDRYGEAQRLDFVLCLGDDFTDEDMFRSIRKSQLDPDMAFPVSVGASSKQTLANWHLLEPADVIQVLGMLNGDPSSSNVGAMAMLDGAVTKSRN